MSLIHIILNIYISYKTTIFFLKTKAELNAALHCFQHNLKILEF